jgi:predicted nucleic acid-binding protein
LVVSAHVLSELTRARSDSYYASRVFPDRAQHILDFLRSEACVTPITRDVVDVATQPKDDLVLATGLSAGANYLATRDRQLLKIQRFEEMVILHPAVLVDLLAVSLG